MKIEDRHPIDVVHTCYVSKGAEAGLPTDVIILIHREELDVQYQKPAGTGRRAKKRAREEAEEAAVASEPEARGRN